MVLPRSDATSLHHWYLFVSLVLQQWCVLGHVKMPMTHAHILPQCVKTDGEAEEASSPRGGEVKDSEWRGMTDRTSLPWQARWMLGV